MQVLININCDNDSFAGSPTAETARILRNLAGDIEAYEKFNGDPDDPGILKCWLGTLRDMYGNTVGEYRLETED